MIKRKSRYEIDMCHGPIMPNIMLFAIPLILSQVLQLLFNAADMIILGQFAEDSDNCLAAVGSTTSLINLLISVFTGITVGSNIVIANYRGAGKPKDVSDSVHTSILTAIIGGIGLMCLGIVLSEPMLKLMDTPAEVLDNALLYIRIYFLGVPFQLIYTFAAAVLRSIGDTKRPMYFLALSGLINVLLNLFFVLVLHLDVAGVAIATAVSHAVSCILVIHCLMHCDNDCRLYLKKLKISKGKLAQILRIGLPSGISTSLFSISNVLIQSSINSMGPAAISGNTIAANIGQFVLCINNAFYQAALSFTSQNYGAHNYKRICDVLKRTVLGVATLTTTAGLLSYVFGEELLHLYSKDTEVISSAMVRMLIMNTTFFIGGIMDSIGGTLRGMKRTMFPTIISLICVCVFRVVWVYTVFAYYKTPEALYISYPISWIIATIGDYIYFMMLRKKVILPEIRAKGTA